MAGEANPSGGAGAGTSAGATGGAPAPGGGSPPAGTGAGGGGQPAPSPRVVPEDILPEELRGRSPQEQKFILSNLAGSMRALAAEKQRLEQELAASRKGGGKKGRAAPPEEEEEKPRKPIEERILDDPRGAIQEVVEELYGPVVSTLSEGVSEGVVHAVRSSYPEFREYEEEVTALLKEARAPVTRQNLEIAFQTVIGRKELEKRRQAAAAALNPDVPKDDAGEKAKPAELTGLEREVWLGSGMSREEWDKYKRGDFEIRVPTGKKEAAK